MTKRKLTKRQDDIRRGLTTPQPYDGIHTCSKGCNKAGCSRGLQDTIEEQDAQIEGLKRDLLEQTAAVRHLQQERIHDLNHIGGQQEENARLKAEVERLTELGNNLYNKSLNWKCYIHYEQESKAWNIYANRHKQNLN